MFQVTLTNLHNESPEFQTFEEAEAWARKAGFEAAIWDRSVVLNWGSRLVATYSPISGLRDLRPFSGKPDPYTEA
jgi:hypothetical protein